MFGLTICERQEEPEVQVTKGGQSVFWLQLLWALMPSIIIYSQRHMAYNEKWGSRLKWSVGFSVNRLLLLLFFWPFPKSLFTSVGLVSAIEETLPQTRLSCQLESCYLPAETSATRNPMTSLDGMSPLSWADITWKTVTALPDGPKDNLKPFRTLAQILAWAKSLWVRHCSRFAEARAHTHTFKHRRTNLSSLALEVMTHFALQTATIGTICASLSQLICRLILRGNLQKWKAQCLRGSSCHFPFLL